ncbi:MAG: hypothetical protein R3279_13640 [Putridiphycobacter sp.]|nr:hypothetical protein [Putridiphycobacter sp.]
MQNKPLKGSYMCFLNEELGRAIAMTEHSIDSQYLTSKKLQEFDWYRMFDYQLDHLHPAEKDALARIAKLLAELAFDTQQYDSRKTNLHQIILSLDKCDSSEAY